MGVNDARDAARVLAGKIIEGTAPASKRAGVKFEEAFEDYVDYLERKAAPKPARWARNVKQLGSQLLLPKWTGWTLAEMSDRPDAVADWHRDAVKLAGPTSANHAARIMRALYKRRAKRDCQSASNFDPHSASSTDPRSASSFDLLERRVRAVALAPSELVGVAETGRARVGV
jgi:hypothetical protein